MVVMLAMVVGMQEREDFLERAARQNSLRLPV